MVAGKVKLAMGLQKSPKPDSSPKPPSPSSSSSKVPNSQKSRSFGMYFPRASAQVQPRPPDVTELLRMVEELRERESRLKTQLLEHKLLRESVAILPVLEREIAAKDEEIERNVKKIECLEAENEKLRGKLEEEKKKHEEKTKAMEVEIGDLKRMLAEINTTESKRNKEAVERDEISSSQRFQGLDLSAKFNQMKNLKKEFKDFNNGENDDENKKKSNEALEVKRVDDYSVEVELPRHSRCSSEEIAEVSSSSSSSESAATLQSRMPRVPKPPPRPSSTLSSTSSSHSSLSAAANRALTDQSVPPPPPPPPPPRPAPPPVTKAAPPPPPPPPPVKGMKPVPAKVRRVPEVVEFYHSLMRRDSRRESGGGANDAPATANSRDMIGEIENRSSHLMAIKTDVETQGDFIRSLIREVENASFTDIKDVVPFVKWLDDELSYLVDERAVLKHFDWPEQKADALREAAFGYCDLKKLESEAFTFRDDHRLPCSPALKKMQALFEKLEHGVYNLSRMRESATKRYNGFHIPTDWMLESGYASQIKLTSVKLAMKYMKRVLAELEVVGGSPEEEELIVQGVRFAFRVHQFAGGFDVETMKAFQELRDKARSCHIQCQNQHHQKFVCRSTTC